VLQTVSPIIDENIAARIIAIRSEGEGMEGPQPIGSRGKSIQDALLSAGLPPNVINQLTPKFTQRSSTFQVEVVAQSGGSSFTFHAILGRNNPRDVQVLSFYWTEPQ